LVAAAIATNVLGGCATPAPIGSPIASVGAGSPSAPAPAGPSDVPTASPSAVPAVSPGPIAGDRLEIFCDGEQTVIDVPLVAVRPDGVHLEFVNATGQLLGLQIGHGTDGPIFQEDIPGAGGGLIVPIPPGAYELSCGGPPIGFAIVDPQGLHVSATLVCDGAGASGTAGSIDYGPDARGPRGALLDVARHELRGLRQGDVVERAGYPAGEGVRAVRVVRAGAVVAVLSFEADRHGGWLLTGTTACGDSGVTAQPPR